VRAGRAGRGGAGRGRAGCRRLPAGWRGSGGFRRMGGRCGRSQPRSQRMYRARGPRGRLGAQEEGGEGARHRPNARDLPPATAAPPQRTRNALLASTGADRTGRRAPGPQPPMRAGGGRAASRAPACAHAGAGGGCDRRRVKRPGAHCAWAAARPSRGATHCVCRGFYTPTSGRDAACSAPSLLRRAWRRLPARLGALQHVVHLLLDLGVAEARAKGAGALRPRVAGRGGGGRVSGRVRQLGAPRPAAHARACTCCCAPPPGNDPLPLPQAVPAPSPKRSPRPTRGAQFSPNPGILPLPL
jgi:hypothetical protein